MTNRTKPRIPKTFLLIRAIFGQSIRVPTGKSVISVLSLLIASWTCSGCFSTHLPATQIPSHLPRLIKLSEQYIPLIVTHNLSNEALGYQYLLFMPISRIYVPHLKDTLVQRLTLHAAVNKYGLLVANQNPSSATRLEVSIESARLNGFDLLAVRRPATRVSVRATLYQSGKSVRECTTEQAVSDFRAFAFNQELQDVLDLAIDRSAQELVTCLGFSIPAVALPLSATNDTTNF
jgi:hypothetical protein